MKSVIFHLLKRFEFYQRLVWKRAFKLYNRLRLCRQTGDILLALQAEILRYKNLNFMLEVQLKSLGKKND